MRIHWSICLFLAATIFVSLLWFGAKNQDFTIKPSEQAITNAVNDWKKKHPSLPPRQRALPTPQLVKIKKTTVKPTPPIIPEIPAGNLDTIPQLEHFREHRNFATASFIQLAIELERKGKLSHALLAWERAIDSTDATPKQAQQARKAIIALRKTQPIWNIDSEDNFDTIIHIHIPIEHKAATSALLGQLSEDLKEASSYQIAPQVLIKTTPQRDGFPTPPIRIWLSSTAKDAKETPQLTLRLSEEEAPLEDQLYMAIYRSISGQLKQNTKFMPPAAISTTDSPRDSLTTHLTRLHWKALKEALENRPPAVIIIEESSNQE